MKRMSALALLIGCFALYAAKGSDLRPTPLAAASGLGVNVPVIGRVIGGGGVLFYTSIDISNNMAAAAQVDYYVDAVDQRKGATIVLTGSVTNAGLVAQGAGTMRAQSNLHFDDFVDALRQAGLITADVRDDGVLGSLLVVFNGATKSGQGGVTARFANNFGGGTVGVSLRGREITTREPQSLVATVRETRGNTTGAAQLYGNLFVNNMGIATNGVDPAGSVVVQVSAVGNTSGQPAGTPLNVTIGSGQTVSLGQILNQLQVPAGADDTYLVYVKVTSGSAAIQGLISQVDATTKDGSAFEMVRADF